MSILQKHLKWAVIGAPSSGKTYLLSDLIHALDVMGFKQEPLPLSAPTSSFGAFFAEISGANGELPQTRRYACRMDDLYSAIFTHPSSLMTIEIDFLNLPGEVFLEAERIALFSRLRACVENITSPVFEVDTYVNPAGRKRNILRYAGTKEEENTGVRLWRRDMRRTHYLDRQQIYAELREDEYRYNKTTSINGRNLLKRFFDIEADSFYDTLYNNWARLFPSLEESYYKENNALFNFYPLMYCAQATDIVLCDKLFKPKTVKGEGGDNYNLGQLARNVGDFVEDLSSHCPNVYLAFRGSDFLLRGCELLYQQYINTLAEDDNPFRRRQKVYTLFCLSLLKQLYGQTLEDGTEYPEVSAYADIRGAGGATLAGMDLKTHIGTRFGHDAGNGFWYLLTQTQRISRLARRGKDISAIFNDSKRPSMPPHVYFTSTPIDEHFCIYNNDPADATRFIHEGAEKIRSFHIETAVHGVKSMCWGSFQLLDDILTRNGIPSPAENYTTPLLNYFKGL